MLPSWAGDVVTRVRPKTVEERGTTVHDWNDADELEIGGCSVQPAGSSLDQDARFAVRYSLTLYAPYDADIKAGDRIVYEGDTFTMTGRPRRWKSPIGRASHLMVDLTEWEG